MKIIIRVERPEYNQDGVYGAKQSSTFVHDATKSDTWPAVLDTFIEALIAAGYLGVRERIKVVPFSAPAVEAVQDAR
jgi:hypothetical protein